MNEFDYTIFDAIGGGVKYTPEEKVTTVMGWVVTGSLKRASEMSGVPYETVKKWKQEAPWWEKAVIEARRVADRKLDGKLTSILTKAVDELLVRLRKGNVKLDIRTGNTYFESVPAHQLGQIITALHGVRALLRGDPTARTETVSKLEELRDLKKEFEEMYRSAQAKEQAVVSDEEADIADGSLG